MDNIEEIFDEFLKDASEGIKFNDGIIKFHTLDKLSLSGTFNDVPILIINNKKELISKLKTYIELVLDKNDIVANKSNIKKCMTELWSSACYEDFSRPYIFLDNRINFYINDEFLNKDVKYDNIVIKRDVEPSYKETPYAFKAYIKDEKKYYLPSINYGISNDTCYIYNITTKKNTSSKYDSNAYLLSISLFLNELYKYGIGKVKVVTCLPMRMINNDILDIFNSLVCMFKNITISSHPFECDEYMNLSISDFDKKSKNSFDKLLFDKE